MRYLLLLLTGLLGGCAGHDWADASNRKASDTPVERTPSFQRAHTSTLGPKGSAFPNYDRVFIGMVQKCWYALLDNNAKMLDRRGKVVVTFRLHYDGRITLLEIEENTVGPDLGLLCQRAMLDPAPFPKWPTEMRQRVRVDYRDVKFTFNYD